MGVSKVKCQCFAYYSKEDRYSEIFFKSVSLSTEKYFLRKKSLKKCAFPGEKIDFFISSYSSMGFYEDQESDFIFEYASF